MKKWIAFCIAACVSLAGCGQAENDTAQENTLQVVTSFYPMYLLASNVVAGVEGVTLTNMTQPQTGCLHDYELTTEDMKTLEQADVFIINGLGMESFLEDVATQYPTLYVPDISSNTQVLEQVCTHDHDHSEHEGELYNAHVWLNPENAIAQAQGICDALSQNDPTHAAMYAENTESFIDSLQDVLMQAEQLSESQTQKVGIFHEGFDYLADLANIEVAFGIYADENEEPSAQELAEAAETIRNEGIKLLLVADDAGKKYAETLAQETGAQVVVLNPLTTGELTPEAYVQSMTENINTLTAALAQ